jgi:inhibitor of cysteine peptidase
VQQVTEKDNGKQCQLKVGGTLQIVLPENPTAGFRWSFQSKAERVWKVASEGFQPGSRPGEGGLHHWVIEGKAPGRDMLILVYSRPWASDQPPAKKFAITIRVAPK